MERDQCFRVNNPNSDCNRCPVAVDASNALIRRRTEPTDMILMEIASVNCPDGLSPKISGDPLLLTNGQSRANQEALTRAEVAV